MVKKMLLRLFEADFRNDSGDSFWGNKGAGVLPYCIKTKRYLINHRSEDVNEPDTWGVWGGAIDGRENPESAALRELREECGYNGKVRLLKAYIFRTPSGSFTYYNFIGLVNEEFEPELDWESQGYEWVSYEELLEWDNKHFGLEKLLENSRSIFERLNKK